jgi:hypothetical protein
LTIKTGKSPVKKRKVKKTPQVANPLGIGLNVTERMARAPNG